MSVKSEERNVIAFNNTNGFKVKAVNSPICFLIFRGSWLFKLIHKFKIEEKRISDEIYNISAF